MCTPETFDTFCPQDKCPGAVCQYFANDAQSTNTYLQVRSLKFDFDATVSNCYDEGVLSIAEKKSFLFFFVSSITDRVTP